jgi:hypothetical protein
MKTAHLGSLHFSFWYVPGFERSNATRRSVAGDGLTEPNINFVPNGDIMQTNPDTPTQNTVTMNEITVFL